MSNGIKDIIEDLGIGTIASMMFHTGLLEIEKIMKHCNDIVDLIPKAPCSLGRSSVQHYKDYVLPKCCEDEINKIESYVSSLDIDLLISKSHNGCTRSQYELARLYDITSFHDHEKIKKDMQKAMKWYAKSCVEGNLDSIYGAIKCFIFGLENPYEGIPLEELNTKSYEHYKVYTEDDIFSINKGLKIIKFEIEECIKIDDIVYILLKLHKLGHRDAAFAIGYILSQDLLGIKGPAGSPDSSLFRMLQNQLKMDKSTIKLIIKDKYEPTDTVSTREMLLIERDIRRLAIYWYNEAAKRGSLGGQLALHKWKKKTS